MPLCVINFLGFILGSGVHITSMSTRGARAPAREYRRRKAALNLDLNSAPPGDNRDQEGPSTQLDPQAVQGTQQAASVLPATIDIEAIDDDVIESSPRAFAEVCILFSCCSYAFKSLCFSLYYLLVLKLMVLTLPHFGRLKTIPEETEEGL